MYLGGTVALEVAFVPTTIVHVAILSIRTIGQKLQLEDPILYVMYV